MEQVITIAICIHAFLGGIGLISGLGSILLKKGSKPHKKMGKLFSISMLGSCLISLVIAWMPNHENLFLFLIGLFTIYLVLAGNRALTFKSKVKVDSIDLLLSGSMLFFSILMLLLGFYGLINSLNNSVLYVFFGSFGLFMTLKDFQFFRSTNKSKWLQNHVGKMVGALIASITAFIVAGLGLGNIISWLLPSFIGTIYIIYWSKKLSKK
ncbi:hypothetical protein FIA58_003650 [Flavobacterium jejuense]|uniref:DUF2306 domain-containing protein n=1 Tax=Flavobacterium jejuense TaxID=1544455 RepID=A0ABX0IPA3_9FLAO|nr:hypothetical protein [Flavobacterium jejuense]NHN24762.1 hypothetical protein [Flavobacterium jejuense]